MHSVIHHKPILTIYSATNWINECGLSLLQKSSLIRHLNAATGLFFKGVVGHKEESGLSTTWNCFTEEWPPLPYGVLNAYKTTTSKLCPTLAKPVTFWSLFLKKNRMLSLCNCICSGAGPTTLSSENLSTQASLPSSSWNSCSQYPFSRKKKAPCTYALTPQAQTRFWHPACPFPVCQSVA